MSLMVMHWVDQQGQQGAEIFDTARISVTEAMSMVLSVDLQPVALCHADLCDHVPVERR